MKICIAQLEIVPGEPEINTKKIIDAIEKAENDGAELFVTSELSVPGYLLGDNWERLSFLKECKKCQDEIIESTLYKNVTVVFGNICFSDEVGEDGRIRKHNCAIVAKNGQIKHVQVKSLQPNYREFDDNRHFYDKRKIDFNSVYTDKDIFHARSGDIYRNEVIKINGVKVGFLICEDGWDSDYVVKPIKCFKKNPDLIVNISCSPFTSGKNNKRNRTFGKNAFESNAAILYVNNVGVQNNGKNVFTFDGGSCIYDCKGNLLNFFEPFEEKVETFNVGVGKSFGNDDISQKDGIDMLYKSIKYGTQKFMELHNLKKVVIGASGGVDSCLVAAIMSEIVGKDNLYLINMPSEFNSKTTIGIAEELAKNIGCKYYSIQIGNSVEWTVNQIKAATGEQLSEFNVQNIQARDRTARILAAFASHVGGVYTCNGNKSELTVGYCTILGDLAGFLAPIADLWKTQVFEMYEYFNKNVKNVIPERVFTIPPSAELSLSQAVDEGKGDPIVYKYHDKLFASWVERWDRATPEDILEWYKNNELEEKLELEKGILLSIFKSDKDFVDDLERWWNLHNGLAVAKRVYGPSIVTVSRRSFGFDMRETLGKAHYSKRYFELKKAILGLN